MKQMREFWALYRESKMGMVGLITLILFVIFAAGAPIIAPYDPSPLNRVAASYSKPFWTAPFDPSAPPTTQVVPNPHLNTGDGWTFGSQSVNFRGGFDSARGAVPGSGVGSYFLTFSDADTTHSFFAQIAYIETSFAWEHRPPKGANVEFSYLVETTGDIAPTDFDLKLVFYSSQGTEQSRAIYRPYPNQWKRLHIDLNFLEVSAIFEKQGAITIRFLMMIRSLDATKTGTATIRVDDFELNALGDYFGVMGTNDNGADMFSQIVWGSQIALVIGILATVISIVVGTVIGLVAGYMGGLIDETIMFITNFLIILPGLVILLALASLLGPSFWNIIWIIAFLGWTGVTLIVRAQTRGERNKAYVMSARAIGASDIVILFRHILPNVTPLLFAIAAPSVSGAILAEAGLSFLGLSDPTVTSWGKILQRANDSGAFSNGAWWAVLFPGIFLTAISLSFVFIGYTVDRILNPRLRQR